VYLCFLAFFHFSEYVATGLGNPKNLSFDSYLVNHSAQYGLAMVVSWAEFLALWWLLPASKACPLLTRCQGLKGSHTS
jgi:protein-S-isoprenylcysteine O-methyltransferase